MLFKAKNHQDNQFIWIQATSQVLGWDNNNRKLVWCCIHTQQTLDSLYKLASKRYESLLPFLNYPFHFLFIHSARPQRRQSKKRGENPNRQLISTNTSYIHTPQKVKSTHVVEKFWCCWYAVYDVTVERAALEMGEIRRSFARSWTSIVFSVVCCEGSLTSVRSA